MVIRKEKMCLSRIFLKLTMLGAVLTNRKKLLPLLTQLWYVPFTWSLTWFAFWILRDIATGEVSLSQVNPMNWAGLVMSIAILTYAAHPKTIIQRFSIFAATQLKSPLQERGQILATKLKIMHPKSTYLAGTKIKKARKIIPNSSGSSNGEIDLVKERQKSTPQTQRSLELNQNEKELATKLNKYSNANPANERIEFSSQLQLLGEIPEECLLCQELTRCSYRRDNGQHRKSKGQAPCHFKAAL
jgi:hypothetical protein